jgi:hypothetical protein
VLLSLAATELDVGLTPSNWSVVNASSGYAQLSGTLAGFVFIALTISITVSDRTAVGDAHKQSSTLLATAFVVLLVSTLFFVVISGELIPYRAAFLAIISSSVLGLGSLLLMSGTAWLFHEHGLASSAVKNFKFLSVLLLWLAATFVTLTIEDLLHWAPFQLNYVLSLFASSSSLLLLGIGVLLLRRARYSFGPVDGWIRRLSVVSMAFLAFASVLMAWLISSTKINQSPEVIPVQGLLQLSEFRALVLVLAPLYGVLYSAVIFVVPWDYWSPRHIGATNLSGDTREATDRRSSRVADESVLWSRGGLLIGAVIGLSVALRRRRS